MSSELGKSGTGWEEALFTDLKAGGGERALFGLKDGFDRLRSHRTLTKHNFTNTNKLSELHLNSHHTTPGKN